MSGDEGDGGEIGWKRGWNNEQEGMLNEMGKMSFEEIAKSTMVKWMSGKVKNARMMEWKEDGMRMMWDE